MEQKGSDSIVRFADRLAIAAARMKAIEATPAYQRKRQNARLQAACILLVGVPVGMLAVFIGQRFGLSKLIYLPIALLALVGSKLLGGVSSPTK
jgi:hypothetical protein